MGIFVQSELRLYLPFCFMFSVCLTSSSRFYLYKHHEVNQERPCPGKTRTVIHDTQLDVLDTQLWRVPVPQLLILKGTALVSAHSAYKSTNSLSLHFTSRGVCVWVCMCPVEWWSWGQGVDWSFLFPFQTRWQWQWAEKALYLSVAQFPCLKPRFSCLVCMLWDSCLWCRKIV